MMLTKTISLGSLVMLSVCFAAFPLSDIKVFDGKKKIIYYRHDSNHCKDELQENMQRYLDSLGNSDEYIYDLSTQGVRWLQTDYDIETGTYSAKEDKWLATIEDEIATIMSLNCDTCQLVFIAQVGIGRHFVTDTNSTAQINKAVEELNAFCDLLLERAHRADAIFLTTYPYQWSHRKFPQNEGVVVRAFNAQRDDKIRMIDVVTETHAVWPYGTACDKQHPTKVAKEIMAVEIMKALLAHDGLEEPAWLGDKIGDKLTEEEKERDYVHNFSPMSGAYALGDTIHFSWQWHETNKYGVFKGSAQMLDSTRDNFLEDPFNWVVVKSFLPKSDTLPLGSVTNNRSEIVLDESMTSLDIVVTMDFFRNLHDFVRDEIIEKKLPVPVQFELCRQGVFKHHWVGSGDDWSSPRSCIVLYPDSVIDPDKPIYPTGFGSGESTSIGAGGGVMRHKQEKISYVNAGKLLRINVGRGNAPVSLVNILGQSCRRGFADKSGFFEVPKNSLRSGAYLIVTKDRASSRLLWVR
ncbi:MAG: hypothetical protein GF344_00200 [Chitinivibrionales bacterium]|nr:hypothetical protein [Chitinivibrionales bacterium]MBD3355552.1 hypothetical protein [Chitinivibrionales bacterium]